MMKWGDFEQIDTRTLRQALAVLRQQQRAAGGENVQAPAFSPACIIGDNAAAKGMKLAQAMHLTDVFASIALTNFFLGYLYLLCERDEMSAAIAALHEDERGAGHDGNDG